MVNVYPAATGLGVSASGRGGKESGDLGRITGQSDKVVFHHLGRLRREGSVKSRREGRMSIDGIVGLAAGFDANSLSLVVWAASPFVEGLASVTVIWRFSGSRTRSATSERTAQRWVAGSFLLLIPFFVDESVHNLAAGSDAHSNAVGIAVTASAIVLMPALGRAKMRLAVP